MVAAIPRSLPGLLALALCGACVAACGEAHKGATTHRAPASVTARMATGEAASLRGLKGDEDDDDTAGSHGGNYSGRDTYDADFDNDAKANETETYYDGDDGSIRNYGQAADAADTHAIAALVKRYHAAAAAADGARACSLTYSILAEAIPEDYGRGAGPAYSRGSTCAVVMSKLLGHAHSTLAPSVVVSGVRVSRNQARALIGSKTTPASYLTLQRERGVWKVDALLPVPLP